MIQCVQGKLRSKRKYGLEQPIYEDGLFRSASHSSWIWRSGLRNSKRWVRLTTRALAAAIFVPLSASFLVWLVKAF